MSLTIIWVLISLMSLAVGILIGAILYENNRKMRSILIKITYLDFYIDAINSKLKDMSEVER